MPCRISALSVCCNPVIAFHADAYTTALVWSVVMVNVCLPAYVCAVAMSAYVLLAGMRLCRGQIKAVCFVCTSCLQCPSLSSAILLCRKVRSTHRSAPVRRQGCTARLQRCYRKSAILLC
jgi:hypothetical protein